MDANVQLIATVAQAVKDLPKPLRDKLNSDGGTVILAAVASKEGGDDECLASHGFFGVAGSSSDERFRGTEGLLELIGARMVVIEDLVRSVAETGGIPADEVIERVRESLKEQGTRRTY